MDFKRLQSIKLSNYNRGAFCSGNSTMMQREKDKQKDKTQVALRSVIDPDIGRLDDGRLDGGRLDGGGRADGNERSKVKQA